MSIVESLRHGSPLLGERQRYGELTERLAGLPLARWGLPWVLAMVLSGAVACLALLSIAVVLIGGVGVWGVNQPVAWGFAITNFVWWIGIGHAGTLISAILLLMREGWRNSVNRFAEAMTLFAVFNASLYPLLHLGRPWKFYYMLPYPNTLELWPQWRSPLVWDFAAVMTYGILSTLFWYLGLLPDLASMRDAARGVWRRRVAGFFALGWRGSAQHWRNHEAAYLILAGLATPLVVSVHSIVGLDFAITIVPGWHATIFPAYFVAGAIFSGMAMVLTITICVRHFFSLRDIITVRHLDLMAKVAAASGLIVAYGYLMEVFTHWYSGEDAERWRIADRFWGEGFEIWYLLLACNVGGALLCCLRSVRQNTALLLLAAVIINVGMWLERYDIIVGSLSRSPYLPSAWGSFVPTLWDWALFVGSLGLFAFLFLLFLRLTPMVSVHEMRHFVRERQGPSGDLPAAARGAVDLVPPNAELHGVAAEFATLDELRRAAKAIAARGYRALDAFTPFADRETADAVGRRRSLVPLLMLVGAVAGAGGAYLLQWYSAVVDYPWNVGGRPLHSWPSFVPLTFELGVLGATLLGFVGAMVLNGLPRPYHPVFNIRGFERATSDRFFLLVAARDRRFDRACTREHMLELDPIRVVEVPERPA